jgi:hypothetical protein
MRRQIFSSVVLLILFLTFGAQLGRADYYTQAFNGYTFTGGPNGIGELFGHVTLNTALLPPIDHGWPWPTEAFTEAIADASMTWIQPNGKVVNMYLSSFGPGGPGASYGSPFPGNNCGLLSTQGAPFACPWSVAWGYKDNPIYMAQGTLASMDGFFDTPCAPRTGYEQSDRCGIWSNWDNQDGPGDAGGLFRGTWSLVPEPPSWMMALAAALVMVFLKFKS